MRHFWPGSGEIVMRFFGVMTKFFSLPTEGVMEDGTPRLFLGVRDFGPWWVELYRIPGEPVFYFVHVHTTHGGRPDFRAVWLDIGHHRTVALAETGNRHFAWVPANISAMGELRLVAEQRDGTILTALWE